MVDTVVYYQYFSTRPRICIVMPSGEKLTFKGCVFVTKENRHKEFLDNEIASGNQMLYVRPGEHELTAEQLDPMASLRRKIIDEYEAAKMEQQNPQRVIGGEALTPAVHNTGMQTSKSIASITVGPKVGK